MTLIEVRRLTGITQAELTERSGVHQTQICHIEQGRIEPSAKQKNKILKALNCHPSLMDWKKMRDDFERSQKG